MTSNQRLHSPRNSKGIRKPASSRWSAGVGLLIIMIAMTLILFGSNPKAEAASSLAPAATITVNSTTDVIHSPGCATTGTGTCSLRDAIIFANTAPGSTITILAGTYTLSISSGGAAENAAASGDLDINASVTINGAGSGSTIITTTYTSACGDCKVFGINQDGTHNNLAVSISGVTISGGFNNGAAYCGTFFETGGGIDLFMTGSSSSGSLTLSDVIIKNNKTTGCSASYGGGINIDSDASNSGSVMMTNVQIINNTADATGGGINLFGTLTNLTINATSVISGNTTLAPSGLGANGGGINIRTFPGGSVAIHGTTIANNTAHGDGGGIDIAASNGSNVTIDDTGGPSSIAGNTAQNNATISSNGAGLSHDDGVTTVTLTNVTISNNHANNAGTTGSIPQGGGIYTQGSGNTFNMTGGSITNNTANDTTNNKGDGGGAAFTQSGGTVNLTNVTISGNTARINGGGIYSANGGKVNLNGTTSLSSNTATNGNGGGINASGGTMNLNPSGVFTVTGNSAVNGGGVAVLGATTNITYANILSNTGSTQGGGLFMSSGSLKMNYSRIKGNTSAGATGLRVSGGTVSDITNNWWACNGDPSLLAAGCDSVTGTSAVNPRLVLHHVASPSTILFGASTGLTADFLTNSSGSAIAVGNLRVLIGKPLAFNNAVKGTLSGSQTAVQSNGAATSTFTATGCNTGTADATVDNGTATASITIQCPDFQVTKANNVGGTITLGNTFTWTLTISNTGTMTGTFADGQTILSDTLPNANISYGSPVIANPNNITNSGNINCSIVSNDLTCTASGAAVTFGAANGRFDVSFLATPSVIGTFTNPTGGVCQVDPNGNVTESNEGNNNCNSNSVTAVAPDLIVSKSNNVGGNATVGGAWNWTLTISNTGLVSATFASGQNLVHDDLPSTGLAYGLPSLTNITNVTNSGNISCAIGSNTLTCSASGTPVTIGASTGRFDVVVPVTSTLIGTYTNPAGSCTVDPDNHIVESNEGNNTCGPDSVTVAPAMNTYVDPLGACGGNTPCFTAPQLALDNTANNGSVTVFGINAVATNLTSGVNNVVISGTGTLNWTGGVGSLFTIGTGNLTVKGLNLTNASTVFNQAGSGTLTAYANNILTSTTAYTGSGTSSIGHNYWGTTDPLAPPETGLSAGDWAKRLGASRNTWAEGIGSATLISGTNTASLSGGSGTAVVVSYGRGLANAPFGNGITPYANQMCSDYYDFFTVGGSGTYTASVPVDNTPNCNTSTLNAKKVFWVVDLSQCSPSTNTACWGLVPTATLTVTISGQKLVVSGLTVIQLGGTPFVAGDTSGSDPTAITLREMDAASSDGGRGWLIVLMGVSLCGLGVLLWAGRRRACA